MPRVTFDFYNRSVLHSGQETTADAAVRTIRPYPALDPVILNWFQHTHQNFALIIRQEGLICLVAPND